jgi:hypothetical protein
MFARVVESHKTLSRVRFSSTSPLWSVPRLSLRQINPLGRPIVFKNVVKVHFEHFDPQIYPSRRQIGMTLPDLLWRIHTLF